MPVTGDTPEAILSQEQPQQVSVPAMLQKAKRPPKKKAKRKVKAKAYMNTGPEGVEIDRMDLVMVTPRIPHLLICLCLSGYVLP